MSSTLTWEPICQSPRTLPDALKFALRDRYGDVVRLEISSGSPDYYFLEGLAAAGVDGAKDLVYAIRSNGSVMVKEQW